MAPSSWSALSHGAPKRDVLDVWHALQVAGKRPWLLGGAGAHPEHRKQIVAFDPAWELCIYGAEAVWSHPEGKQRGPALDLLREAIDSIPRIASNTIAGGLFGWLGFEAAALWEPTLNPAPREAPDAVFRFCRATYTLTGDKAQWNAVGPDPETTRRTVDELVGMATPPRPVGPLRVGPWTPSMDASTFMTAVERVNEWISSGDLFQANIATRFTASFEGTAQDMYAALRDANPSPFMTLMPHDSGTIVSNSPELLFAVESGVVRSRPIAGTRRRGADPAEDDALERELLDDEKEQAEHTMLVDLLRNDTARVSLPGSVRVPERGSIERYRRVMHLVSRVEGDARPNLHLLDYFQAFFPGGTITGAPKLRATQRIMEVERSPRGAYTGSAGFLACNGESVWNIMIRTLVHEGNEVHVQAGSGIVADSVAESEWREAGFKAQALMEAARAGPGGTRLGEVTRHTEWTSPRANKQFENRRVLCVDNEDSFVYNLADYAAALGADVRVIRADAPLDTHVRWATHIILSPGPGHPRDAGQTPQLASELIGSKPLLGICLGHQAMAEANGGRVAQGPPVHGKTSLLQTHPSAFFGDERRRIRVARYHSLYVPADGVPPGFTATAHLDDGMVMAMEHNQHPVFGLQFHPESICTEGGMEMIARFLEST